MSLHQVRIPHLDLKPSNVLLKHDGKCVLTDFGSARVVKHMAHHTASVLGTSGYQSPEHLKRNELGKVEVGEKADVWCFGCVALFYVMGRHCGLSDFESGVAMATNRSISPLREELGVSNEWREVLEGCFEMDGLYRSSSSDVLERLCGFRTRLIAQPQEEGISFDVFLSYRVSSEKEVARELSTLHANHLNLLSFLFFNTKQTGVDVSSPMMMMI